MLIRDMRRARCGFLESGVCWIRAGGVKPGDVRENGHVKRQFEPVPAGEIPDLNWLAANLELVDAFSEAMNRRGRFITREATG